MDMDGKSLDITAEKIAQLRALFPEVFSEDKIDVERLKRAFGEAAFVKGAHYELSWAGKDDARSEVQKQTSATLIPDAKNADLRNPQHVFIEGENLDVLRILQKSYFGKVKMIYIDPPYNTGNDTFVYADDFAERKKEYEERTGIKNTEGYLRTQNVLRRNTKENGHFHSVWLSMMFPRLYLSRNLLKEEGVIFISIDDNEASNLKLLCDEIFGEANFEGHIHWRRRHNQPNDKTKMIGTVTEHILCYAKNSEFYKKQGVGKIDITGNFTNPDNDVRGDWASKPWKVGSDQSGSRYEIIGPSGKVFEEAWMGDKETYKALLADGRIIFPKNGDGVPRKKYFRFEREKEGQCATNWWSHEEFGHNQIGNDEMTTLFGEKNVFSNPKPTKLIRGLIQISNAKDSDIVFDFFAGSGTTAQAVLEMNEEDGGNRRFVCVQMPEPTDEKSEARKAGYATIADITRARIAKVRNRIVDRSKGCAAELAALLALQTKDETTLKGLQSDFESKSKLTKDEEKLQISHAKRAENMAVLRAKQIIYDNLNTECADYTLAESNFKIWQSNVEGKAAIAQQLLDFTQAEKTGSEPARLFTELCLKSGLGLNVAYTQADGFYKTEKQLWFCFEPYTVAMKTAILRGDVRKVIFLNSCFQSDKDLSNFQLELKEQSIDLTII